MDDSKPAREKWDVVPLVRFGPVELGGSRLVAQKCFRSPPNSFRKGPRGPTVDAWFNGTVQLFCAKGGRKIEYVEISRSTACPVEPSFMNMSLLETPAEELISTLATVSSYDEADPELGFSYVFPEWELSFWRPVLPDDDPDAARFFATVGLGVKGYYSER